MNPLQNQISQKIFKGKKSRSGKTYVAGKRLAGHLVAGVIDGEIGVGFSYLHKKDRHDIVDGVRKPGHGMNMAIGRAIKSRTTGFLEVPPSLMPAMTKFVARCEKYYKNMNRPDLKLQPVIYPGTEE